MKRKTNILAMITAIVVMFSLSLGFISNVNAATKAKITAKNVTINVGDKFDPMDYVTATDKNGKDITKSVTVTKNDVDVNTAGKYTVEYSVGDVTKSITVKVKKVTKAQTGTESTESNTTNVVDPNDAVIKAKSNTIKLGAEFDPFADTKAIDKGGKGDDISNKMNVKGIVDTTTLGKYKLTYYVTGANGNEVSKDITITVSEDGIKLTKEEKAAQKEAKAAEKAAKAAQKAEKANKTN